MQADTVAVLHGSRRRIDGGATITANDLTLEADSAGASIGAAVPNKIDTSISGSLTASTNTGAGGIFINEINF